MNVRSRTVPPVVIAWAATSVVCVTALAAAGGGLPGVAQADALVYHRYAQMMRAGHFYAFNPGDAPTTGCTSHLWLWLTSLPAMAFPQYRVLALFQSIAGLLLFAATVFFSHDLAKRIAPSTAPFAALLVACSGQTALTSFSQVDMALYIPVVLGFACATAAGSKRWMLALAAMLPWVRPEGVVFPVLLAIVLLCSGAKGSQPRARALVAAACSVASTALVFAFNRAVTGRWQFDSIAGAKPNAGLPVSGVAAKTTEGILVTWETALTGAGGGMVLLLPPLVGTFVILVFFARRDHKPDTRSLVLWLGLSVAATIAIGSVGGYIGQMHFRLLAWAVPVLLIFFAAGLEAFRAAFPGVPRWIVQTPFVLWQIGTVLFYGHHLYERSLSVESRLSFVYEASQELAPGSRVGMKGAAGFIVAGEDLSATNVAGYTSGEFSLDGCTSCIAEVLKHQREARFDAWLIYDPDTRLTITTRTSGDVLARQRPWFGGGAAFTLMETDWAKLDAATGPVTRSANRSVEGKELVARLDVGYPDDEKKLSYQVEQAASDISIRPFVMSGFLEGVEMLEAGITVTGRERFVVPADPAKPLTVVVRAAVTAPVRIHAGGGEWSGSVLDFPATTIAISIDGNPAGSVELTADGHDHFAERAFTVPEELLNSSPAVFEVTGNHHSLAWWFYQ